ncbi:class I adenylate-forming enzyme family protein [Staphylospora marina]|uniref:class I adenylate-forming enzyme family protein n=1 Tax=Staphylospora marina TaxID=2490858 RepID=UPI000F5BBC97|nr:long-chain-fatty-acid--CoA ligase [Staphylospora marina]
MSTIGELLRQRTFLSPDVEAVVSPEDRLTYREYNAKVNRLAHYLLERGTQRGDRIAFLCQNHHLFPVIYLAAAKVGAIAVPLNTRLKPEEIRWMLEDCTPRIVFHDEEFTDKIAAVGNLALVDSFVPVSSGLKKNRMFEEILRQRPDAEPDVVVEENDPVLIIYTSGTTGRPKGVVCTHANVYAAALANVNTLDLRYMDRFMFVTPLFHISGMMFIINALVRGMTVVTFPSFDPLQIWNWIDQEKVTGMMSVPPMLGYMLQALKGQNKEFPSLRGILCGGATVPDDWIRAFHELGYPIIQVYGATEFTGAATYFLPHFDIERCDSVGKGVYGTEIKILDPITGAELPPGEPGEIVIRGKMVFEGYWNNPEASEEVIRGEWYHTKDIGKMDEEGYVYVIDRLRDMIICGGEKVYPAEVEYVIHRFPDVVECAVVGVEDPIWGEVPRAYIVKKEGSSLTENEVLSYVRSQLADYKLMDVVFLEQLPKNSMGKILKYVLREMAARVS